jgi:hypothetical protein
MIKVSYWSLVAPTAGLIMLACGLNGCITVAHGLIGKDGPDTARRISSAIPDGASESDTKRIMETHGYRCATQDDARYDDPVSRELKRGRILSCVAAPGVSGRGGFLFSDEYSVAFLISDGRSHLIFSRVNVTGS